MDEAKELLRKEAKGIQLACLTTAEEHYAAETPWFSARHWLGVPLALLSAVASAAAFSKLNHSEILAGIISLMVAVLTALSSFLTPEKKANEHHKFAKDYERLYNEVGYFFRVESVIRQADLPKLEEKLIALKAKMEDLNHSRPGITKRAGRVAAEHIKNNTGEVIRVIEE
jgi:hypothetical protein